MATIEASFPVPVLAVPPRSRNPRVMVDLRPAAVSIPEADPSEFTPVPYTPSPAFMPGTSRLRFDEGNCRLLARGGALWHRLVGVGAGAPVSPEAFLDRLASAPDARRDAGFDWFTRQFSGSPLLATTRDVEGGGRDPAVPDGLPVGTRVLNDPGNAVEMGLRTFLANEVALAGDGVYVRLPGPMAVQAIPFEAPDLRMTLFPALRSPLGQFCRHDDVPAFLDLQERHGLPPTRVVGKRGVLIDGEGAEGIPRDLLDDGDLRLFACRLAVVLHAYSTRPGASGADEANRTLQGPALLARVGLVPGDYVESALVAMRGAIEAARANASVVAGFGPIFDSRLAFAADFIDTIALPRLATRNAADSEADAPSLSALGPG